ncbi:HEPN/Toprim-associated domain-containing protein [Streptomyces sp. NPDC005706]|uniref:HEPN/Toprim-associated domain-containing protein n=1 Tax=Streptomyces sp. NPDC005706 TaxID=3157169 RepID=UPI003410458C
MGHHSYLEIAGHTFLYAREGYLPDVAALFTEEDRCPVVEHTHDDGQPWAEFTYQTTVMALRERLQVQGFTQIRAREALAAAITAIRGEPHGATLDTATVEDHIRRLLASDAHAFPPEENKSGGRDELLDDSLDEFAMRMDSRHFVRLLLDCAPAPQSTAGLDLTQLTGCCVELDAAQPIAEEARAEQLADLTRSSPLLVLTEGPTDARLLSMGMEVTHPHLKGFVTFFDYDSGGVEGGVAQLARNVAAFVAAGVANRFVAIADNDTEGIAGMEKTLTRSLPGRCRVMFYPSLPELEHYPTLGPYTDDPVPADVNGRAGALELYLGQDVLQTDSGLMPVQWKSWNPKLGRYQGALADQDKRLAQERFLAKVRAHRVGGPHPDADWSGIRAIIDQIVSAFD